MTGSASSPWPGSRGPSGIILYQTARVGQGGRAVCAGNVAEPGEKGPLFLPDVAEVIEDIERARPRFVVLVNASVSWGVRPGSDRTLFQWWEGYQRDFDRVGFVDITDHGTTYVWGGDAAGYVPRSLVWLAVFERKAG